VGSPSLAIVDALARLQLAARRDGYALRLHGLPTELRELIAFCGLNEALGIEPRRQPEEREEPRRVEEEGELGDAVG
jgi:hypothetical protein